MDEPVRTFDYVRELKAHEAEVFDVIRRVLFSGSLLLGEETRALEGELAEYLGATHCVAVASGTMALQLSLMALGVGPGDEVVTVANTCPPTIASALVLGARPVFVDVDPRTLMMNPEHLEAAIGEKTRAIVPVHLWGQSPKFNAILEIADGRGIPVIEDCAQSFGTLWEDRHAGSFGAFGCHSFYPTKNLGSYGDAGAIVTESEANASRLRRLRMYGYEAKPVSLDRGTNGRISELQASLVRWKLGRVGERIGRRRETARLYLDQIRNGDVGFPEVEEKCRPSYHQFVIRTPKRDALRAHLASKGVETSIHYADPLHRMPAFRDARCIPDGLPVTSAACGEVLSLPVHDTLRPDETGRVVDAVNSFEA